MIDISNDIFKSKELTIPALYNDVELEYGCILSARFDAGRPGVAGEYRPQIREGAGNHSTIYVKASEAVFMTRKPQVNDRIQAAEYLDEYKTYTVRAIRGSKGGIYELLVEQEQTRVLRSDKGAASNLRRVSN